MVLLTKVFYYTPIYWKEASSVFHLGKYTIVPAGNWVTVFPHHG